MVEIGGVVEISRDSVNRFEWWRSVGWWLCPVWVVALNGRSVDAVYIEE